MWTLGADPEFFLRDSEGEAVPAVGLVGGKKGAPEDLGSGYGVQVDNVMLEFNVPPTRGALEFYDSIDTGLRLSLIAANSGYGKGQRALSAHPRAEVHFQTDQLAQFGESVFEFGCSPDYDAYQEGAPALPVDPDALSEGPYAVRFAGGHIHFGSTENSLDAVPAFVRAAFADLFLGLPSIGADSQPRRRSMYGQAGRHRPTTFGFEYRTLSNFWVADHYAREAVAARASNLADLLDNVTPDNLRKLYAKVPWAEVQGAINNEDEQLARSLIKWGAAHVPGVILGVIKRSREQEAA